MFIDIHSHLDLCKNVSQIIENAKKKRVNIITCGVDVKSNRKALEFKSLYNIGVCLGIYPVDALKLSDKEIDSEIEFISNNKEKIKGIGEVGLDLKHGNNIEKQKEILTKFVLLAKKLDIPIIIHSRQAEKQAIELLENIGYNKVIMHCFSGNMKLVKRIVYNNWSLSIPANIKHSNHFQKLVEIVPIDNLFCETDSPYLHPEKKFPNEPVNVLESYKKISEIKKMNLREVEKKIEDNYNRIFKL